MTNEIPRALRALRGDSLSVASPVRSVCPSRRDPQRGSNMGSPGREPGVGRVGRRKARPARRVEYAADTRAPVTGGPDPHSTRLAGRTPPPAGHPTSPGFTRGYPRWTGFAGPLRTSDIVDRPAPVAGEFRIALPAAFDTVAPVRRTGAGKLGRMWREAELPSPCFCTKS